MKRMVCACLAALLLATGCAALATAGIDFSGLTLDQLYEAREALNAAISALEAENGATFFEDGSYLVGRDIPEGDYALQERENVMFASVVVRAGDTEADALLLHKLITGQADIHLETDTWVTLSGIRAWPLGTEPSRLAADGSAGEGAYLVGTQLPAGVYTASQDGWSPLSSYSIYSAIAGVEAQLTKFEVLHGDVTLILSEGDYIELSGCVLTPLE